MSAQRRVAMRLLRSLFVIWASMSLVFVITNFIGDPAAASLGPNAHAEQLAQYRERHGLDRPFVVQYFDYLAHAATGDLGRSFRDEQPVLEVILTRLPRTMLLGAMAIIFELCLGVSLGVIAALRRRRAADAFAMGLAFLGVSAPTFLTGLVFLQVFAFRLGWFPVGGYGVGPLDHLWHGILPAFTLAIVGAATYARLVRGEMIETLRSDYVRTARMKGLSPRRVVVGHALRNALLPAITLTGLSLPLLVSGAIITESLYDWPGMGRLAIESIHSLDVPMLLGIVLFASIAVQVGNLGAELVISAIDPRVKFGATDR